MSAYLQPILDQAADLGTKAGVARAKGDEMTAKAMRMALSSLKAPSPKQDKVAIERAYASAYAAAHTENMSGVAD